MRRHDVDLAADGVPLHHGLAFTDAIARAERVARAESVASGFSHLPCDREPAHLCAARAASSGAWQRACPVPREDLRYMRVSYWGFDGRVHAGELMMNKDAVRAIETVMRALFTAKFPIRKMVLVDSYGGSDPRSMHDNNTYAFGCAPVPGSDVWSQHSYGRAIDLNPIQNPEIRDGRISPPEGAAYIDRARASKGMILASGPVVRAFTNVGWTWGGHWRTLKDYMHFSANGW